MNLTKPALEHPYAVLALVLVVITLGFFAFWNTPTDLFPDTVPPQVLVIAVEPGASADDMNDKVTQVLEKEINTIEGLKRVVSTSRDEVSSINAEFLFEKPVGEAIVDVQNAVARVRGALPEGIQEPLIFRITDAIRPLMTVAVRPKEESLKTLADVRLLSENDLKDLFLAVAGVADVEVFGGHRPEVVVRVDRDALSARGLTLPDLLTRLATQNVTSPVGVIYGDRQEYLTKVSGEFSTLSSLALLPIASTSDGGQIRLGDIAQVEQDISDLRSFYHGNGRPAIGLNLLRADDGNTVEAIVHAKEALTRIEERFDDLDFSITDDQQPIIDINLRGMRTSLLQAVILTVLVIFLFLADSRAAAVASVSIPLSFLTSMIVIWASPHTLNMVTLSGLIVAVGMVVDASVVVLENIYRHYSAGGNVEEAAAEGTGEVSLAITAGMLTTVVVLVPVMFAQGYTSKVMEPLNLVIITTLVASLIVSLTVVPLVAKHLLRRPEKGKNRLEAAVAPVGRLVDSLTEWYVIVVRLGLRHRVISLLLILGFLVLTARLVPPLLGTEQMPPMDTGIVIVELDTDASAKPEEVEVVLDEVEKMIYETPGVIMVSSVAGSEPGAVSFGGGGATSQSVRLTVNLVDRTRREATIWEIEQEWREGLRNLKGVRTYRVSEYGATPVSTTKAPLNLILAGPNPRVLDSLADEAIRRLRGTPGLVDLRRSWYLDKKEVTLVVDPPLARLYDTSPEAAAFNVRAAVQGIPATQLRLEEFLDIPIRVRYLADQVSDPADLGEVMIPSRLGLIPLRALADTHTRRVQPSITRENLQPTIDITGGNIGLTIGQVTDTATERLSDLKLPAGYTLTIAGTARDMRESQAEMGKALLIGIALLYILLLSLFHSFSHPLTIMAAVPLAAAGALWGLLLFDKPMCMPALMGIILLGGTIVNNSILLMDFILQGRKNGLSRDEAILESVRLRLRPILMTATSTIIGLSPLIFELAVGLERMSPLGIAAGTGLLAGTVVTTVAVPILYSLIDSLGRLWKRAASPTTTMLLIGAALTFGSSSFLHAEQADSLTLPAAVEHALEHHPDLDIARARVEQSAARAAALDSKRKVHLDAVAEQTVSEERHTVVPAVSFQSQKLDHLAFRSGTIGRVLLWDFGQTSKRVRSALQRTDAKVFETQRVRQWIVYDVARHFLGVLTVEDLLEAARSSRLNLKRLLHDTEQLRARGRAAPLDVLKVRVRLARVETRIEELAAERISLRAGLAESMGWKSSNPLPPLAYREPDTLNEAISADAGEPAPVRPDIEAFSRRLDAATSELEAARKDRWPRLELEASYFLYAAPDPRAMLPDVPPPGSWEDDAVLGVRISFPLWDSGLRESEIREAVAARRIAEAELERRRLAATREVLEAKAELQGAMAQVRSSEPAVAEAREALRVENLKYQSGRGVMNDVLDAEASLLEAEAHWREARRQVEIARLAVDLAEGRDPTIR